MKVPQIKSGSSEDQPLLLSLQINVKKTQLQLFYSVLDGMRRCVLSEEEVGVLEAW